MVRIRTHDECTLNLLIQSRVPGTDGRCRNRKAFDHAVELLKIVAHTLESRLEAEELRRALEDVLRAHRSVLAHDVEMSRTLHNHLPELPAGFVLPEAKPQTSRLVDQVRRYVLLNYHRPDLSLAKAAASVRRSTSYISTLFVRETDVPFHAYVAELRLAKARQLLRDPSLTVEEVAQRSGYASACWFRHVFKQHMGLAPSEWRRARQAASPGRGIRSPDGGPVRRLSAREPEPPGPPSAPGLGAG